MFFHEFSKGYPIYLPTYLPTCLPTYVPTYLRVCLPTGLPTYLPTGLCTNLSICTFLPIYLFTYVPPGLPIYLQEYLPSYIKIYPPTCRSRYLLTVQPTYLPIHLPIYPPTTYLPTYQIRHIEIKYYAALLCYMTDICYHSIPSHPYFIYCHECFRNSICYLQALRCVSNSISA